ncbi:MAG: ArsB/NhaD family transporter [Arachnia sp.]
MPCRGAVRGGGGPHGPPISNLTNLLALTASGLTFARFTALMALPWVGIVAVEYLVFRKFFASELSVGSGERPRHEGPDPRRVSGVTTAFVCVTLAGFVLAALLGVPPAWAAAAGAIIVGVRALQRRKTTTTALLAAANLPFCLFVLALGVLVLGVTDSGLGAQLGRIMPTGTSLPALLGFAALAAVAANLLNNLPAVLLLTPLALSAGGPVACLAVLIGVNVGPNLTYVGSLATLLWRRVLREHDTGVSAGEFSRLGAWSVPIALIVGTCLLWVAALVLGE